MLRSPIRICIFAKFILVCFLSSAGCASCGFIDLRPIKYSVEPCNLDSILDDYDTPLIVRFDTEMVKKDVENIFQVNSDYGAVKGDFNWQENDLYFTPVSEWTSGIRYTFGIAGTIRSKDGRELRIQHFSSFYAINKMPFPLLESYFPQDGQSVGTGDFYLELLFTNSMDRLSVESALSINGISNKTYEWKNDDKTVVVNADKQLVPWSSYRWNLKDSARSIDGLPLPKQYSGFFFTNLDQTFPEVINVYPASFSGNSWNATGREIETGLTAGEGIIIEFNKNMDENILRSLRFDPSLSGYAEMLAENKIIYIIPNNLEPDTSYTLIISADAKDTEGLKLDSEFRLTFTPDIPYLKVISFNDGQIITENLYSGAVLPVRVNSENKKAAFSLGFSLSFNNEEKQNTAQRITLSPFFPKTISPIGLQFINWTSDDRIRMEWTGLDTSHPAGAGKIYYLLTIPGGRSGISAQGFYMKEDLNIYLEAVNE